MVDEPLNVILPLSQLNEPGFQEGSIYSNDTLSSGADHTCAILDNGSVSCWGWNLVGEIGDGTTVKRYAPTQTMSLGNGRTAVAISSGKYHTCAILDNGSVSCWGYNNKGQLGDGTNTDRYTPALTSSLGIGRTAVAISSGSSFTCVILDDGNVSCWGKNTFGNLGDGTTVSARYTPAQTSSFGTGRTAVAISSGFEYACALLDDGTVSCWGSNYRGELGNSAYGDRYTPSPTASLGTGRTAVAISSGATAACAILDNGSVSCWGYNGAGSIGDGTNIDRYNPVLTSSLGIGRTAVAISSGGGHSCVILDNGSISCWGYNHKGQLGDNTTTNQNTPSLTLSLGIGRTAIGISSGGSHTCAILDDGNISCWGYNSVGSIGDGTNIDRYNPVLTSSLGIGRTVALSEFDLDGDGVLNHFDAFPNDPSETTDSDGDGIGDNADVDFDNDGVNDSDDAFPSDPTESEDSDDDGVGDNSDAFPNDPSETTDSDGDGVGDNSDQFPNDSTESVDTDNDGTGDNADDDDDGDSVLDIDDAFPLDASESVDTDNDGIGDNTDTDDDGDGVLDTNDDFPLDATETIDSDDDGVGDNSDEFPNDPSETTDSDDDGVGDNSDQFPNDSTETIDSDDDGVGDNSDEFPLDATEDTDTDSDGIGNNADTDDDGDGFLDDDEFSCWSDPLDSSSIPMDYDGDFSPDCIDLDDDGDGVSDQYDAFPYDSDEQYDFDGDWWGDNSDICPYDFENDADEDGVCGNIIYVGTWPDGETQENPNGSDDVDAFPYDPSETMDSDNDGIGNNADNDDDNDGVMDYDDAFPYDSSETMDSDLDGIGDNADNDDDDDGIVDSEDAFPTDPYESQDSDYDGVGDNSDMFPNDSSETMDSDGDGVGDNSDEFPNDPTEWLDTDGDGVGDNAQNSNTDDDGNNTDTVDNENNTDTVDNGNNTDAGDGGDNVTDVDDITPSDPTEPGDTVNNGTDDNIDDTDDAIAEPITDDDSSVPGFTGILATIALLGAIYIRRDD